MNSFFSIGTNSLRRMNHPRSFLADAVEMLFTANEEFACADGYRGIDWFAERVGAYDFADGSGFDDERITIFTGQQDLIVESHRRRCEGGRDRHAATFVFDRAGPGFET